MWEQYCIVSAKKYVTALIKGKGNWSLMDTIKTSNSHNLSSTGLKDLVYLGLDFIFIKLWKIITFHALLKSGGCWLLYCAVHLKMTFSIGHNRLHDTHFDRAAKNPARLTPSLAKLSSSSIRLKWPAYSQIFFSARYFWRGRSPGPESEFVAKLSSRHSLGHGVFWAMQGRHHVSAAEHISPHNENGKVPGQRMTTFLWNMPLKTHLWL